MKKKTFRSGFTLIELTFAIAFISVLLITVALVTNEIITLYRKGYAIKTVNAVGRDLIEDLTNSIQSSPPASISSFCDRYGATTPARTNCERTNGLYSVYQQFYTDVKIRNGSSSTVSRVPTGGIFCSGKYTYIWNTGYVLGDNYTKPDGSSLENDRIHIRLNDGKYFPRTTTTTVGGTTSIDDSEGRAGNFRLVKIEDSSRAICAWSIYDSTGINSGDRNYDASPKLVNLSGLIKGFDVSFIPADDPVEILGDTDASLALYDFVLFPPAQVAITNRLFYSGSFILGTINGDVNIMTSSNFCQAPTTFSADFSYCAINKFNFSTQASGE